VQLRGVIVSCCEWLQNKRSEFWDLDEADRRLHKKMVSACERVRAAAKQYDTDWRTAAYIVALGYCIECGNEIPRERLEAVPHTRYCVTCKSRLENSESYISPIKEENESWWQDAAFATN
jgi:RNA polymerase-binding transcription factor DksA